jgi:hypothetical protein
MTFPLIIYWGEGGPWGVTRAYPMTTFTWKKLKYYFIAIEIIFLVLVLVARNK